MSYDENYRLGFEIGIYEGRYENVINMFKVVMGDDYKKEKSRIKYLSNIELKKLLNLLVSCYVYKKSKDFEEADKVKFENEKTEILKLLR